MDTVFLFFYLACFLSAIKVIADQRWLIVLGIITACLLLIKSVIGITIFVPIILYWKIQGVQFSKKYIATALTFFLLILLPPLFINYAAFGYTYFLKQLSIGLRTNSSAQISFLNILNSQTFQYLHFSIAKWYTPTLIALVGSLVLIFAKRNLIPLYGAILVLFYGFLSNDKTEIWHLIPLYPFLALILGNFIFSIFQLGTKVLLIITQPIKLLSKHNKFLKQFVPALVTVCVVLFISFWQLYLFRNLIKLFDREKTDLAVVSQAARGRDEKLYLAGENLFPAAVFYSQKQIILPGSFPTPLSIGAAITQLPRPFLLLSERWRIDVDNIKLTPQNIVKEQGQWLLLRFENTPL